MNSHSLQERAFVHAENYFININLRKVFHALLILIISICTTQSSSGQQPSEPATISPGGVFDQVFDRFGLSTDLSHLAISEGVNFEDHSVGSCASNSIFDFYFESGSGFEDDQDQEHLDRRSILCGLGEDLSDFITISNPTIRINIWVRDFSSLDTAITGISAGSSYYLVPSSSQVTGASITEGAVWNTIKSGADIYRSIVPSTYDPNKVVNSNGEFFHGYIAFDFSQPYHADYTATPTGDYDLYTIALKELTHALGMASLIGEDGNSVFPSGYNYYSRYDTFLETQSNSPLITSTGNCTGYNYSFNPALNAATLLDPEGTCSGNPTISCGLSVHFGGTANQDVYTPSCFQPGLSLSHFVDQCHDPNAYNSGEYYVLSAETFTGPLFQKRYLKEEERLALSDIGYTLAASYGSTGHGNSMTYYGAPGPLITVVGVNDGLTSISTYAYFGQTGSQLTIDDCLGNDAGSPTVLECAEVVIGNGAIALSGNSILYTPDVNTGGVHVLRYVPKLGSQKGTITYVIIYTYLGGCGTVCDLVGNGGFENGNVTCVPSMTYFGTQINCWLPGTSTPGYFGAGCGTTTLDIPTGGTYYSNVPIDSWNGTGNQNFMGLWAQNNSGGQDEESIQTILGTPLIPGNYYILSFYAQVAGSNFFAMIDANIAIGISTTSLPYVGNPFDYNQPGITQITGSQPIVVSETPSAFNNGWHLVEYPFIYNGPP
ncbi:MAG: hypothetical protein OEW26_07710, partial [Nitrospirota bacterium]|nr:hypothetical protein [Nitrospirota bacterium]